MTESLAKIESAQVEIRIEWVGAAEKGVARGAQLDHEGLMNMGAGS